MRVQVQLESNFSLDLGSVKKHVRNLITETLMI